MLIARLTSITPRSLHVSVRTGEDLVSEPSLQAEEISTGKRRFRFISASRSGAGSSARRTALRRSDLPQRRHRSTRRPVPNVAALCDAILPLGRRLPAAASHFRSRGSDRGTSFRDIVAPPSSSAVVCRRRVKSSSSSAANRTCATVNDVPSNRTRRRIWFEFSARK